MTRGRIGHRNVMALVLLIGSSCLPWNAWALQADAGTNNPFDYGVGSRALAMAGAYVAVADDVTGLFWNPGGLAQLDRVEISAMHIELFFNTPYDFIGAAYPLLDWGTFSLGAVRVATEGIVLRDERSHRMGDGSGSLDMREYMFGFSRELPYHLQTGLALKIDQQRLLGDFSTGVGLDLGVKTPLTVLKEWSQWQGIDWDHVTLGVTMQNLIGSRLKLDDADDILPLNLRAGLAYCYEAKDSLNQQLLVSGSWEKSTWRSSQLALGLEYQVFNLLAVRGGLSTAGWAAGAGVGYAGMNLDYALAGETLGITHRFTLTYRFGSSLAEQRQERERQQQAALDAEAERRARHSMEKASQAMEKVMQDSERQHRKEKQALLAEHQQLLELERRQQLEKRQAAVADEYFKALHYFQGIKDFMAKNYKQALIEFETVAKYDPQYLELPLYLSRTRQRLQGGVQAMNTEMLGYYYKGIDYYIENRFEDAIVEWEKILKLDPNNNLAARNIEEARERAAKVKAAQSTDKPGETAPAPAVPEAPTQP